MGSRWSGPKVHEESTKYKAIVIYFCKIKLFYKLTKLLIAISRWCEPYTVHASKVIKYTLQFLFFFFIKIRCLFLLACLLPKCAFCKLLIIICRNSFWVKVNLVKLHSLQLMQCRHPGSQAKAAAASSNREGKEKMKNDDFFVGKKWNRSRSSSKNSIHFCCQRNSIKKKRGRPQLFQFQKLEIEFSSLQKVFFY